MELLLVVLRTISFFLVDSMILAFFLLFYVQLVNLKFLGALAFDMEYARWLEEHNKLTNELRDAVNTHAGDDDLRSIVDSNMAHCDEIFRLKGVAAKADAFHVLSGMWKTPVERCFMWLGGFRSSELLKVPICLTSPFHTNALLLKQ